jgi:uncharacterized protein YecE (DUF72 family)
MARARFFENARQLEPRLEPILYQLPPQWPINLERLEIFLRAIEPAARLADDRPDAWAEWLAARTAEGLHVFAYFNNDTGGHASRDAARLRQKIAGTIARRANARAPRTYTSDR